METTIIGGFTIRDLEGRCLSRSGIWFFYNRWEEEAFVHTLEELTKAINNQASWLVQADTVVPAVYDTLRHQTRIVGAPIAFCTEIFVPEPVLPPDVLSELIEDLQKETRARISRENTETTNKIIQ